MKNSEERFNELADALASAHPDVERGKMMSSPGIKCRDKVFAFYYKDAMCFRLGKGFDIESHGVKTVRWLNPFKSKPPMKAWFVVGEEEQELWEALAGEALAFTRSL